jgi:hypothetical protein
MYDININKQKTRTNDFVREWCFEPDGLPEGPDIDGVLTCSGSIFFTFSGRVDVVLMPASADPISQLSTPNNAYCLPNIGRRHLAGLDTVGGTYPLCCAISLCTARLWLSAVGQCCAAISQTASRVSCCPLTG